MNILFTICARAGSKGLVSKNLRNFCGEPIVKYSLAAYQLFCRHYKHLYEDIQLAINTDSKELIEQINQMDIKYLYVQRKKELAGDAVAKIDVIKDTLEEVELQKLLQYDIVIDLDLTSPLRNVEDIKGTLDSVCKDADADISYSVTESRRSPYFNMVNEKENGYFDRVILSDYSCRQQTPICFDMNASIYAYKRNYLFRQNPLNRNATIWKMKDTAVLDIDCEMDLKLMEVIANYYFTKGEFQELQEHVKKL